MRLLIDLVFVIVFIALALGCLITFFCSDGNRFDLLVYAIFSTILSMLMLNTYVKRLNYNK